MPDLVSLIDGPVPQVEPQRNVLSVMQPQDVTLEDLPYRYPTRSALTLEAEVRQVAACVARGFPRLTLQPMRSDALNIVGYGPTLVDTWPQIAGPCITMSGSHDFLLDRGVQPTYHAQCDGRDHQVGFLTRPQRGTTYLMASVCPPKIWDALAGHDVRYWHNAHGQHIVDWIGQHDSGAILVAGGSNIGLSSIHLGGILGYRRFRLFGMDGHSVNGVRHAGRHLDPHPQRIITRVADGRTWETSPQMSNACDELTWLLDRSGPQVEIEVMGDSLQAAVVREWDFSRRVWGRLFVGFTEQWVRDAKAIQAAAEPRRSQAQYNTGSIPEGAAVALRALVELIRPARVIEIGTFIGTSTLTLASTGAKVLTCDNRNNCLPSTDKIRTFPYTTSTKMLRTLVGYQPPPADLFFFDGRIQTEDLALIQALSHPRTVYAFDDYVGHEKGVVNVARMQPLLPNHRLVVPCGIVRGTMTIALLVPKGEPWP